MKTFFSYVALFAAVSVILGCIVLVAAEPTKPISYEAQQFKAFEAAYITADNTYRIDDFNKKTKGEFVNWEGTVRSINHTGTSFDLVPIGYESRGNDHPRLEAFVILDKGYVPSSLRQGTRVKVLGHITSTSVLSVIVTAKSVKAL